MSRSTVKEQFEHTFLNLHGLKIETILLHGHRYFTAWEWVLECRPALQHDGKRLSKEEAPPGKLTGCTLMWWNDKDKIFLTSAVEQKSWACQRVSKGCSVRTPAVVLQLLRKLPV